MSPAGPGEFLFVARIQGPSTECVGALISPSWIVTAAHCFENVTDVDPDEIKVVLGDRDRSMPGREEQWFNTRAVILHPGYDVLGRSENDIALILLDGVAEFNMHVKTVRLPSDAVPDLKSGRRNLGTAVGWGLNGKKILPGLDVGDPLLRAEVAVFTPPECREAGLDVVDDQLCVGHPGNDDSLTGFPSPNPGSPLLCDAAHFPPSSPFLPKYELGKGEAERGEFLCGLATAARRRVRDDAKKVPHTLFTRVSHHLPWIERVIREFPGSQMATRTKERDVNRHKYDPQVDPMSTLEAGNDFSHLPFLGILEIKRNDSSSKKRQAQKTRAGSRRPPSPPETCTVALIGRRFAMTASDCVGSAAFPDDSSSYRVRFGGLNTTSAWTRANVLDAFLFHPDTFLNHLTRVEGRDRSFRSESRAERLNKAVVLELTSAVSYSNDTQPISMPTVDAFVGLHGVLAAHNPEYKFGSGSSEDPIITGRYKIVSLDSCPKKDLYSRNLHEGNALCAESLTGDPCDAFPRGGALFCESLASKHGNTRYGGQGTKKSNQAHQNSTRTDQVFLCGMLANPLKASSIKSTWVPRTGYALMSKDGDNGRKSKQNNNYQAPRRANSSTAQVSAASTRTTKGSPRTSTKTTNNKKSKVPGSTKHSHSGSTKMHSTKMPSSTSNSHKTKLRSTSATTTKKQRVSSTAQRTSTRAKATLAALDVDTETTSTTKRKHVKSTKSSKSSPTTTTGTSKHSNEPSTRKSSSSTKQPKTTKKPVKKSNMDKKSSATAANSERTDSSEEDPLEAEERQVFDSSKKTSRGSDPPSKSSRSWQYLGDTGGESAVLYYIEKERIRRAARGNEKRYCLFRKIFVSNGEKRKREWMAEDRAAAASEESENDGLEDEESRDPRKTLDYEELTGLSEIFHAIREAAEQITNSDGDVTRLHD